MILLRLALNKEPNDRSGKNPLYFGARFNQVKVVKYLAEHSIKLDLLYFLNSKENYSEDLETSRIALKSAALNGNKEIVFLILAKMAKLKPGSDILEYLCCENDNELMDVILGKVYLELIFCNGINNFVTTLCHR